MRGNFTRKWVKLIVATTVGAMLVVGCGVHPNDATVKGYTGSALQSKDPKEETAQVQEPVEEPSELYIVENLSMTDETLLLYQVSTDKQFRFSYNMTTKFLDKYGGNGTWAEFTNGSVVTIGDMLPASGALSQVQKSPDVWMFDDISKFKIDVDRNLIEINGSNYKLMENTRVYSDDKRIEAADIHEDDIITVIGRDKEVLSIAVTTGHGYMSFVNTSVFDGSLVFIGNKIVSMVNGNMTIAVPEGTYMVTVANNGWGGSAEYTVKRNENTLINLDEMKGDGPSYCMLTFLVTVPDTYVYIDGEQIDVTQPVSVQYGKHKLVVKCNGYTSWNKTLVVNSESAEITLEMEAETENNQGESEATSEPVEETTESTETPPAPVANTPEEETAGSSIKNDYDYEVDYLSTISDLLSNLMD